MNNLAARVDASLRDRNTNLWLPGLATELVETGWRDLRCMSGLTPDTYGTARAIARDSSAPRRIVTRLPVFSGGGVAAGEFQVEALDEVYARGYKQAGVKFYPTEELVAVSVLEQLRGAINILRLVPTLLTTVASLVRTIHVIDPDGDDYDISFSEPHIPFSIFVSVPRGSGVTNPLRVAEAIVHEAMHLQLTFIEKVLPLVQFTGKQHYSPWREEFRNAQGLLHGLYVFCVINEFLRSLPNNLESDLLDHVEERLSEVRKQVNSVWAFQNSEDLTEIGAHFTRRMILEFHND